MPSATTLGRLVINTTLGIGGLFDPATAAGSTSNDRDFGQTLGKWGLTSGPYLVLPLLGPSDVRDGVGRLRWSISPTRATTCSNRWVTWRLWGVGCRRAARRAALSLSPRSTSAYDPYALVRNAYLQRRDFKVYGDQGNKDEDAQEQQLFDEALQDTDAPAPPREAGRRDAQGPDARRRRRALRAAAAA